MAATVGTIPAADLQPIQAALHLHMSSNQPIGTAIGVQTEPKLLEVIRNAHADAAHLPGSSLHEVSVGVPSGE